MMFAQIDTRTVDWYIRTVGPKLENPNQNAMALVELMALFSMDFDVLTEGDLRKHTPAYIQEVVKYLDGKWTRLLNELHKRDIAKNVPPTGYGDSLLQSRPDIKEAYEGAP